MLLTSALILFFLTFYTVAAFGPKKIRSKCGHEFYSNTPITAFEKKIRVRWQEPVENCPDCTGKKAIPCCHCGQPIIFYDRVVAYMKGTASRRDMNVILMGTSLGNGSCECEVGCPECAISGADINGRYMPPGIIQAEISGYERALLSDTCGILIED